MLPAEAAGIEREWPTVRQICRIKRWRQFKKNGEWQPPQHEVVHLISSLSAASPQALLASNRNHWGIEIMHRNIFSLTGFILKILKFVSHSPTRAIEHFQDNKNRAIRLLSGLH